MDFLVKAQALFLYKKPEKFYCSKSFTVNLILSHAEKINISRNKKTDLFTNRNLRKTGFCNFVEVMKSDRQSQFSSARTPTPVRSICLKPSLKAGDSGLRVKLRFSTSSNIGSAISLWIS